MSLIYDLSKIDAALRHQIESNPKAYSLFTKKPDEMLRIDGNAKTIKGRKKGFVTAILYMAPANMSGENLCPLAFVAQCDAACLFTAGRGGMNSVMLSRLRKALYWQQYRDEAIAMIKDDIRRIKAWSDSKGYELLVRLNGTTDIRFENYGIIQAFPDIQFYDYTKIPNRRNIPSNYDLTFSYSGVKAYRPMIEKAKANQMRIAVVFRDRSIVDRMLTNREAFEGLAVVDGDDTDIRHLDPINSVVALYAKGKAKTDQSGFVIG